MCSLAIECVLLPQNVLFALECVLLPQNVFCYHRICSLTVAVGGELELLCAARLQLLVLPLIPSPCLPADVYVCVYACVHMHVCVPVYGHVYVYVYVHVRV